MCSHVHSVFSFVVVTQLRAPCSRKKGSGEKQVSDLDVVNVLAETRPREAKASSG